MSSSDYALLKRAIRHEHEQDKFSKHQEMYASAARHKLAPLRQSLRLMGKQPPDPEDDFQRFQDAVLHQPAQHQIEPTTIQVEDASASQYDSTEYLLSGAQTLFAPSLQHTIPGTIIVPKQQNQANDSHHNHGSQAI